ncbi:hypothetical protein [Clostridium magnum]|uniref:hypothetical protein n=1 Tax=Clostridium magnum TaxID=33954 RepID=UPI000AA2F41F|nr:hypothetical protein [Clostridium magnum]
MGEFRTGGLKKAFYMIIATAVTKPVYTKINAQTRRIQTVDFSTSGNVVAP